MKEASRLAAVGWVQALLARESVQTLTGLGWDLPEDHLLTGLLRAGLLTDLICAHDTATSTFYTLTTLGSDVCGHRGIAHGGLSAALLDETLGGAVYMFKAAVRKGGGGSSSRPGSAAGSGSPPPPPVPGATPQWATVPAFTAALDVAYKATLPAGSTVAVIARVDRVEGRKAWVVAQVVSRVEARRGEAGGGGEEDDAPATTPPTLYAEGRALFVVPRAAWEAAAGSAGEAAPAPPGGDETEAGVERRVVHAGGGGV